MQTPYSPDGELFSKCHGWSVVWCGSWVCGGWSASNPYGCPVHGGWWVTWWGRWVSWQGGLGIGGKMNILLLPALVLWGWKWEGEQALHLQWWSRECVKHEGWDLYFQLHVPNARAKCIKRRSGCKRPLVLIFQNRRNLRFLPYPTLLWYLWGRKNWHKTGWRTVNRLADKIPGLAWWLTMWKRPD